jgi:hypothetical protein
MPSGEANSIKGYDFTSSAAVPLKFKYLYDGSNRIITVLEAPTDAKDQDKCLRTDLTYVGATTNIDKQKESVGTWLSAYDI